jgi:hypothetical protein
LTTSNPVSVCKALCLRCKPRSGWLACTTATAARCNNNRARLELSREVRDTELQRLKIGEPRSELSALFHIFDCTIQAELRTADRAGADIQPPPSRPAIAILKP